MVPRHPRTRLIRQPVEPPGQETRPHLLTVVAIDAQPRRDRELLPPCAQASTIRARSARPCAVLRRLTQFSNVRPLIVQTTPAAPACYLPGTSRPHPPPRR